MKIKTCKGTILNYENRLGFIKHLFEILIVKFETLSANLATAI